MTFGFRHGYFLLLAALALLGAPREASAACVSPAGQSSYPVFKTNSGLQFCPDGDNWSTILATGAGVPGGSTGHVQFNNAGVFAGDAGLFWDNTSKYLVLGNGVTSQWPTALYIAPAGHATSRRAALALDNWALLQDTSGNGTKDFSIWDSTAAAHRLFIGTSGNVGIGTISPGSKLVVTGSDGILFQLTAPSGSIYAGVDSNHPWIGTSSNHTFRLTANGASHVYLTPAGNVGIGTATPSRELDVGGSATTHKRIGGRGGFALAAAGACLGSTHGAAFLLWSAGTSQTCSAACAAASGSCIRGWTMWTGEDHYEYQSECSAADPSSGQSPTGKYCCCRDAANSRSLYAN